MRPFPNPLVVQLLALADELAVHGGGRNLRQAALRRAVSSAYYALFHALCYVCSDGLAGWRRTDLVNQIYRTLDHGTAKRRLGDPLAATINPALQNVGLAFIDLQERRHLADYGPPGQVFTQTEALALIQKARGAVDSIQQLDPDARMRLAILLVINKRPM